MDRLIKMMLLCGLISTASAASFDCGRASTDIEKIICSNEMVSQFDEEMAALYKRAKLIDQGVSESQKAWIAQRNSCDDENCVVSTYMQRNQDLQRIISDHEALANSPPVEEEQSHDAAAAPVAAAPAPVGEQSEVITPTNASGSTIQTSSVEGGAVASNGVGVISDASRKEGANEFFRYMLWAILVFVSGIAVSLYLHSQGHITIFENFTDLVFVAAFPFILGFTGWLLYVLFDSPVLVKVVVLVGATFYVGWNIYTSFRSNETPIRAIVAILAKTFLAGIAVCGYLFSKMRHTEGDRKKDESREAYELRLQREEKITKADQAFWVGMVAMLGIYSCREREFVPLDVYFSARKKLASEVQPE